MGNRKPIKLNDISKDTEKLASVAVEDLMPLPGDFQDKEWDELPEDAREEKLEGLFRALPPDTQVWMVEPDGEGFKEDTWGNLDDTSKQLLVEDVGRFEPGIQ